MKNQTISDVGKWWNFCQSILVGFGYNEGESDLNPKQHRLKTIRSYTEGQNYDCFGSV